MTDGGSAWPIARSCQSLNHRFSESVYADFQMLRNHKYLCLAMFVLLSLTLTLSSKFTTRLYFTGLNTAHLCDPQLQYNRVKIGCKALPASWEVCLHHLHASNNPNGGGTRGGGCLAGGWPLNLGLQTQPLLIYLQGLPHPLVPTFVTSLLKWYLQQPSVSVGSSDKSAWPSPDGRRPMTSLALLFRGNCECISILHPREVCHHM